MKRTFITNLLLLVGLNLLIKPLYLLVVESEIQNRIGPEIFGSYFALINFTFIFNILLDLGTTNWNTRKISQEGQINSNQYSGMIKLRALLAGLYLIVAMTVGVVLNYSSWQLFILFILALNQVMVSGILYLRSYLTGMHLFRRDSVVSVLDRTLLLVMMSILLWVYPGSNQPFNIEWLVWGQMISYGLTFITAIILIQKKSTPSDKENKPSPVILVLKESSPFAMLILLSMLGNRADSVMLERMSGSHEAGIYAMGFRFFEAINMIAYLFAVLLLPMFSRLLKHKEPIAPLLHLSFKILFSGIFIITVMSCFYGHEILSLIYDQNIESAAPVFSFLMVSSLFFSLQYISGTLITASGKMRPMIYIALAGMIYNLILNFYYIPHEGALGAAKASCLSQVVIFFAQIIVIVNSFESGDVKKLSLRTLLFVIFGVTAGYFLHNPVIFKNEIPYSAALLLFILIIAALATKMLDIRQFLLLLKTATRKEKQI